LSFVRKDIRDVSSWGLKYRDRFEIIHASGLLNQFWDLPDLLRELRATFPGKLFVVQEYLGKLGPKSPDLARFRLTLTYDLFQALTDQPIPPSSEQAWRKIFEDAGCSVLKTYQGEASGLEWVLYVLLL
jgi:hypothetical protein